MAMPSRILDFVTKSKISTKSGLAGRDMYWTYILESLKTGKYYIGSTNNLERRLLEHNRGKNHFSKCGKPWKLIYKKEFSTRKEAIKFEKYLKSLKKRKYLFKITIAG